MCLIVKMVGAAVTREAEIHVRHPHNERLAFTMNVTVSLLASALIPAGLVKDVTAIICVTGLLGERPLWPSST